MALQVCNRANRQTDSLIAILRTLVRAQGQSNKHSNYSIYITPSTSKPRAHHKASTVYSQ